MNHNPTPTLRAQLDALELFCWLALEHPELGAPYLTFSTHGEETQANVQVPVSSFEAWREVLCLPWENTILRAMSAPAWSYLKCRGVYERPIGARPVSLVVDLMGTELPPVAERPSEEWEARLVSLPSGWRAERAA